MRVLLLTISYAPNVGGVETHLADWVRWLRGRPDFDVDVLTYQPITTDATGPSFEQDGRLRIFRIRWFGRTLFHRLESRPALQFLYLVPRLLLAAVVHILRHGRPDVLHAHGLAAAWVAARLKSLWKVPVVVSFHAVYAFPPGSATAARIVRVLRPVDRVLTLSDASVGQLVAYGLPRERVSRYTYWVNLESFRPRPAGECRAKRQIPGDAFVALFVGRLIPLKGVALVLELARLRPDMFFVIAGDGPMEGECAAAARMLPNLRFVGRQPNEALPELYAASDILLVPSRYEEGYGRVACEALASGTPVMAAGRGGLREVVEPGTGQLVDGEAPEFAAALDAWRGRGGTSPAVRQACRARAEARFGSSNAEEIEHCLTEVVQRGCG